MEVWADPAVGVKVYPATNGKLGSVATNGAVDLVLAKASIFLAKNTTQWLVMAGA